MERQQHFAQKSLLGIDTNYKTVKGQKFGFMTGILYLSPADLSGWNVCPMASDGCKAACLNTAGRGGFTSVQKSRLNKTRFYFNDREGFMALLVKDVIKLVRKAAREGFKPAVRLNGTSDIPWERVPVTLDGERYANIMEAFSMVQFYDYTKIEKRALAYARGEMPRNYHVTFSVTEENDAQAMGVLEAGGNVAAVFLDLEAAMAKGYAFGAQGVVPWAVVDGDESDLRFNDPLGGVIAGLKAKGKARGETSGFVRTV
jgi:hypothetical protein